MWSLSVANVATVVHVVIEEMIATEEEEEETTEIAVEEITEIVGRIEQKEITKKESGICRFFFDPNVRTSKKCACLLSIFRML